MSRISLSENLKYWRCERPGEWKMDEFIRIAAKNELLLSRCRETISEAGYEDHDHGLMNDIDEAIAD